MALVSRFPHLSWMRFRLSVPAWGRRLNLHMRGVTCGVSIALQGGRSASQITDGRELNWREKVGMVSFVPPDGEQHTCSMTSDAGCELFVALIPQGHIKEVTVSDGVLASHDWSPVLASKDTVVHDCTARLAVGLHAHDSDMAGRVGMSPSHFAMKFRRSTGLSLQRFINRRRILRSLETLKSDPPLASIALGLGFSSQSHFNRLFSDLTGMTPAKYRKQSRRTVC